MRTIYSLAALSGLVLINAAPIDQNDLSSSVNEIIDDYVPNQDDLVQIVGAAEDFVKQFYKKLEAGVHTQFEDIRDMIVDYQEELGVDEYLDSLSGEDFEEISAEIEAFVGRLSLFISEETGEDVIGNLESEAGVSVNEVLNQFTGDELLELLKSTKDQKDAAVDAAREEVLAILAQAKKDRKKLLRQTKKFVEGEEFGEAVDNVKEIVADYAELIAEAAENREDLLGSLPEFVNGGSVEEAVDAWNDFVANYAGELANYVW